MITSETNKEILSKRTRTKTKNGQIGDPMPETKSAFFKNKPRVWQEGQAGDECMLC